MARKQIAQNPAMVLEENNCFDRILPQFLLCNTEIAPTIVLHEL